MNDRRRKLTDTQLQEMITLKQAGWPVAKIAKEYGVSQAAAVYHLRPIPTWPASTLISHLHQEAA